jgi:hypothetical protein
VLAAVDRDIGAGHDRIAKPAHSTRDYCNAHECPPCPIAKVK